VPNPSFCCTTSILLALQPMLRSSCSSADCHGLLLLLLVNGDVCRCRSSRSPPLGSLLFSIPMHLCSPPQTVPLYLSSGYGLGSRSHVIHNPYRKLYRVTVTRSNRCVTPYFRLVQVRDSDSSVEGGVRDEVVTETGAVQVVARSGLAAAVVAPPKDRGCR
jgi:hypothetical protein